MRKMKLIHCSDIHLDSALNTHLTWKEAQARRKELFSSFTKMILYAEEQGVRVILIAGDLFDTETVSESTRNMVLSVIREHAGIDFLYLSGNHDEETVFQEEQVPKNLKLFLGAGRAYRYGNVVITGLNRPNLQDRLRLKEEDINIVMFHGQIENVQKYAGRNIDYMALGHIHQYGRGRIDERGEYCYCGCLEPRGFDECGKKGFVLLETGEGHHLTAEFVPFSKRTAYEMKIDISGMKTTPEIYHEILIQARQRATKEDMLSIVLTGKRAAGAEFDVESIETLLEENYYIVRIKDESDALDCAEAKGFEAHFIQLVMESEEEETVKKEIIDCALKALHGSKT